MAPFLGVVASSADLWGWTGAIGNWIQSYYAWAAYNRDAFVDNVSMRQAQMYQKKNYQLGWLAVARDDIRDMMGISVTRINNYMVVATLLLSVAASGLMGVSFNDDDPDFLVHAFFCSTGISVIYLVLAIMFAVLGQNCAFTNTMKLLTYEVRPENPAEYNHDYMKQAQYVEKLGCFQMFRIPGVKADYKLNKMKGKSPESQISKDKSKAEDSTPVETLEIESQHLWYLTKFWNFSRLWLPYDTHAKLCMGLGIVTFGHASAYFVLAKLITTGRHMSTYSACGLTFAFEYLVGVVTLTSFKTQYIWLQVTAILALVSGPIAGTVAAFTESPAVSSWCVPVCYMCHALYFVCGLWLSNNDASDARLLDTEDEMWRALGHEELEEESQIKAAEQRKANSAAAVKDRPARCMKRSGMCKDGSTWPTETDEFEEQVGETKAHVRAVLRCSMFVSFAIWATLFAWSLLKFWTGEKGDSEAVLDHHRLALTRKVVSDSSLQLMALTVQSSSHGFHPHAIACGGDHVFLADKSQIFQISEDVVTPHACKVNGTIGDLTVMCDEHKSCWPMALVHGSDGLAKIVDCRHGDVSTISKAAANISHFDLSHVARMPGSTDSTLFLSHLDEVDIYSKTAQDNIWRPQWPVGKVGSRHIDALGAAGSRVVVFHIDGFDVHETETWEKVASYETPNNIAPIRGGCAFDDASKLLLLPQPKQSAGSNTTPFLVEINLSRSPKEVVGGHNQNEERTASLFEHAHGNRFHLHQQEFLSSIGHSLLQNTFTTRNLQATQAFDEDNFEEI